MFMCVHFHIKIIVLQRPLLVNLYFYLALRNHLINFLNIIVLQGPFQVNLYSYLGFPKNIAPFVQFFNLSFSSSFQPIC